MPFINPQTCKKIFQISCALLGVPSKQKTLTKWDPHGMIDTYGGYLKTIVSKSRRQGGARDQADKFM